MIASSVPLFQKGELKGCFSYSVFMDIWDAHNLIDNLMQQLNMYRDEVHSVHSSRYTFEYIIGQADNILEMNSLARKAALHPSIKVLLMGEIGTGRNCLPMPYTAAATVKMPFIRVNCAAIPENLLEAELFGYEEGSFTGARKGGSTDKFGLAHGVLFS